MSDAFPFELMEDPAELARFEGWREEVYRDLLAVQDERMSMEEFDGKHLRVKAILVLDLTGFTEAARRGGCVASFLRIVDAQKVCLPVLREAKAEFARTFADDIVALFAEPGGALDAAFEIHRRSALFQPRAGALERAECCIGLGYGPVYAIGPNHAMGDEMNRTSKLGEDTARGGETLVTEGVREALAGARADVLFESQTSDDRPFPYYKAAPRLDGLRRASRTGAPRSRPRWRPRAR